jgi:hypothetical protein
MDLMSPWTLVQYQAAAVESSVRLISMGSAQMSSGPQEVATIHALFSRQFNTVAILVIVVQQISLGFSSRDALMLIAIPKMTQQAPLPVLVELIMG